MHVIYIQEGLTFDVQKDWAALDDVRVAGDAVAHPAAVVSPGGLLDALQDEHVGVVDGGEHHPRADVVVAVLAEHLALKSKTNHGVKHLIFNISSAHTHIRTRHL